MDQQSDQLIIETFKEERIDMVVTLPEEPTSSLTEAIRKDPSFTSLTVAAEGNGIALCAGAALGGSKSRVRHRDRRSDGGDLGSGTVCCNQLRNSVFGFGVLSGRYR